MLIKPKFFRGDKGNMGMGHRWWNPRIISSAHMFMVLIFQLLPGLDAGSRYGGNGPMLKITSVEVEPYLMRNWNYKNGTSSRERPYIGYIADLVDKLAEVADFRYELLPVADGSYGYRQADGSWDGMVGDLLSENADIAAAPMYVTAHRAAVVSFTDPYMTVQATLLLRKPAAISAVSIRDESDLINQSEIKYGTLNRGVLVRAFKRTNDTTYKIMWRNMMRYDDMFTETNEEGIERVRRDKYGFVLPNTIGEYISMREPCDLVTVGRFLMKRGYALAVKKGSPLLHKVNKAIAELRETGYLDGLYRRWWIGRSECNGIRSSKIYSISSADWNYPILSCVLLTAVVEIVYTTLVAGS